MSKRLRVTRATAIDLAGLATLHALVVLLFIVSTASGEAAGWDRLPLDEAWTRMTYIRNFSDSFAFEFSSGDASTGVTSPLWTMLNGATAAVFGIPDSGLPGLAKLLGIMLGVASVWMAYRITWQITRKRYFGLFAGAVLAVEPHFGYAAVSGTETALFAATSLFASWAFLRGHVRTAGIATAFVMLARPEGLLLVALIVGATLARWIWRREGAILQRGRDVHDLLFLGLPTLLVLVLWVIYDWAVTGEALPDTYLATHQAIGVLPLSNLWHVWLGYLHELPFMDGLAWVVGLPLIVLGIYAVISRHQFSAVPLALFPLALIYAAMVTYERPETLWMFEDRRHLDPAVPFIVIMLAVGTARSWQLVWAWKRARNPLSERERKSIAVTAVVAVAALAIAPLAALPVKWDSLTTDYSWSSRNTNDLYVDMGRWLGENTPGDAVIGVDPPGAVSFFAGGQDREIIDLTGQNTHDVIGTPAITYGLEAGVDYLVTYRGPLFDSISGRATVYETRVASANPFATHIIRAYGPEGSADDVSVPREEFASFDSTGLEVIDMIDTGNGVAPAGSSEAEHNYSMEGDRTASTFTMRVGENAALTDDSRAFNIAEEFIAASVPGQPLTIVKRYQATLPSRMRVIADGVEVGAWDLPAERSFFGETSFTIPTDRIANSLTQLRFEVIPGPNSLAGSSFFYWILVPEGSAERTP